MQRLRCALAALLCALFAATALAQDYTTTQLTRGSSPVAYVAPPGTQTVHNVIGSAGGPGGTFVDLPFSFPYFGTSYSRVWVCSQGFIQFGAPTSGGSVQYANTSWPPSGVQDGMVAALWDDLDLDPSGGGGGQCVSWTTGSAPNRTWIVSWEQVSHYNNGTPTGSMTFQVQLSETSGRIVLAYSASGSWTGLSYSAGIDAVSGTVSDGRSYAGGTVQRGWPWNDVVLSSSGSLNGLPPRDIQFDPRVITFSGTLQYDRIVTGAGGIGTSTQSGVPISGVNVEIRRGDGSLGFRTTTDANGAFSLRAVGMDGAAFGNLVAVAETTACVVRPSATAGAHTLPIQSNVALNASYSAGTRTIGAAQDAGGALRAPFDIALAIQTTAAWVKARETVTLPQLDVLYDTSSSSPTLFSYATSNPATPARLRIASTATQNPDGWDAWIVRREYGRHVLVALGAPLSVTGATGFDSVTDPENAFATAFGVFLHAAVTGETKVHDGVDATTAVAYDLETPVTGTPKSGSVALRVAGALFDLLDAANEPFDGIDGTAQGGPEAPLATASAVVPPATADSFLAQWISGGRPGLAASRIWIGNGVLDDDSFEPNDTSSEVASAGAVPLSKPNLVLNVGNEDWFSFQTTNANEAVAAEVFFDRAAYRSGLTMQVLNAGGTVLASSAPVGTTGPFRATTGPLAPGTYRVRIAHATGPGIGRYTLQISAPLVFTSSQGPGWTIGRPLTVQFSVSGGVPPYAVSVDGATPLPAGLALDTGALRVTGTPTTVGAGTLQVTLTDSGSPAHVVTAGGAFTVNPTVLVDPGAFTPFALGHAHSRPIPVTGGTSPRQVVLTGSLPSGISYNPGTQRFVGTPSAQGATGYRLDVTDAAGSVGGEDGIAVVCVPTTGTGAAPAELAAGSSATGFYFDAIEGSTASLRVATAKGSPARTLAIAVIGPDGQPIDGTVAKGGKGRATASKIRCDRSGRYFVVLSSASGDAAQLTCSVKSVLPSRGAAKLGAVASGTTFEFRVGALAGAVLKFKATPDKPSGAELGLALIEGPDGTLLDLNSAGTLKQVANGVQVEATLPKSGTWRVVVVCRPDVAAKKAAWSFTVKQPAGVTFDVGDAE